MEPFTQLCRELDQLKEVQKLELMNFENMSDCQELVTKIMKRITNLEDNETDLHVGRLAIIGLLTCLEALKNETENPV